MQITSNAAMLMLKMRRVRAFVSTLPMTVPNRLHVKVDSSVMAGSRMAIGNNCGNKASSPDT